MSLFWKLRWAILREDSLEFYPSEKMVSKPIFKVLLKTCSKAFLSKDPTAKNLKCEIITSLIFASILLLLLLFLSSFWCFSFVH